jgi:ferric-dicitrate binding protein FerR (iron transport regulator)
MSSFNKNIDFKIIWKKINSNLTELEERDFNQWLESDNLHQDFFEKAKFFYNTGKVKNARDLDVVNAWDRVEPNLEKGKKRVLPDWLKIVGSVAATIAIMISVYFVVEQTPEQDMEATNVQEMVIPPGTSRARLIFDDGETVDLSAGRDFHGKVDGATISNKGNQISYEDVKSEIVEVRYNTLEIPRGAEYFVTLSDGTKVWLNSDSRLKYPVAFIGATREVELEGEAFFIASINKNVPFHVKTGGQVVEVLGTEFNISAYPDDELIYTTLVEGKVKVFSENNPDLSQNLTPGYQTYMFKESGDISIRKVDVSEFVAWKDGFFNFNNRTLEQMMGTLSRWYDIDVVFESDSKKKLRFTGEIERYKNLEQMLQLIEKTQEVKFEKSGNEIRIR